MMNVRADRGIRDLKKGTFEAVGNAVINYQSETIYGEKATINMTKRLIDVVGNVRYSGPKMSFYGQELNYNLNTGHVFLKNARILSSGYTVVGEKMVRISPEVILGENTEYTTCIDCPESWSIYGKKIKLVIDDYIYIKDALIKSNGVAILYLPYVILPIKRGRQTGLLFPQIMFNFKEGVHYRQPWFWAISNHSDMTLIPGSNGERGFSNELEYRKIIGEAKWLEIHSLETLDKLYLPPERDFRGSGGRDAPTGEYYYRHLTDYEHHFQMGNFWNHHFNSSFARELDFFSDYPTYAPSRLQGSELPIVNTFLNGRSTLIDFNIETYYNQNLFIPRGEKFDSRYVQILPKTSLQIAPIVLFHNSWPIFRNATLGGDIDTTYFKQKTPYQGYFDKEKESFVQNSLIRNSLRSNFNPYLTWTWGRIGPISLESKARMENVYYSFPYEKEKQWFYKRGTVWVSDLYIEIDKVFGVAYTESLPVSKIKFNEDAPPLDDICNKCSYCSKCIGLAREERKREQERLSKNGLSLSPGEFGGNGEDKELIGTIPKLQSNSDDEKISESYGSYRHSLFLNVRHFYTSDQNYYGSERFGKQIQRSEGLFDSSDAPRKLVHIIGSNSTVTGIPERNSVEFRLLNSLFKKSPNAFDYQSDNRYLTTDFSYSKLASFNISQGITLNTGEKRFIDNLTRLAVDTSFPLGNWGIGMSDYYFYTTHKHKFTLSLGKAFETFTMNFNWSYDSTSIPINKVWNLTGNFTPISMFKIGYIYEYNQVLKKYTKSEYSLDYQPPNKCWKLVLNYADYPGDSEDMITFNLMINFGDSVYSSIFQPTNNGGV